MPGYIKKALKQFKHKRCKLQHQPYHSAIIKYGAKTQYTTVQSTSPQLDKHGKKLIQHVCGKFLFLGQAVDSTLMCPISAIALQTAKPTKDTMEQTLQLGLHSRIPCHKIKKTCKSSTYATIKKAESTNEPLSRPRRDRKKLTRMCFLSNHGIVSCFSFGHC